MAIGAYSFFIVLFGIALWFSFKKTLYSYRNIILIGGVFFFSVLLAGEILNLILFKDAADSCVIRPVEECFIDRVIGFVCFTSGLIALSNTALCFYEGISLKNLLGFLLTGIFAVSAVFAYILRIVLPGGFLTGIYESMLCYGACAWIGTMFNGALAAEHTSAYDRDFAIILGCSISKKGGLRPLLKRRTDRAIRFAWDQERATGKPVLYVPSGGQGANEIISEGSAMELYIVAHGAEFYEVFPEKESKNTYENMLFSKRIIDRIKPEAKVCFVTNNYHILRSGMLANMVGLCAEGVSASTRWYYWPNGFVREFVAIMVMHKKWHLAVLAGMIVWHMARIML